MSRIALLAAALCAVALSAAAQTVWTTAPTAVEMAAAYPPKAKAAGVAGMVEMSCTVLRGGAMSDCVALREGPTGYGFAEAARKLGTRLTAPAATKGSEVTVVMLFPAALAKGEPLVLKTAQWTALPSVTELQAAVPKTEGGPNDVRVALVCDVQAGGVLSGCTVDREEPAGQGFGQAILALAPRFKAGLMSTDGVPTVGAKVRLPVRFALTPVDQAAR